jgi:hypothetical protein
VRKEIFGSKSLPLMEKEARLAEQSRSEEKKIKSDGLIKNGESEQEGNVSEQIYYSRKYVRTFKVSIAFIIACLNKQEL